MFEVNKLFSWLSIRSKLIIAFVGLSVLPIICVGLYGIVSNTKSMKQYAIQELSHDLTFMQGNTANLLASIERDLRLIQNLYVDNQIRTAMKDESYAPDRQNIKYLEKELLSFAKSRNIYYQIRIVDEGGNEIASVHADSADAKLNTFSVTPKDELTHTPLIFYQLMERHLLKDQIALAPAELLGSDHKLVSVITFAMPLFSKDKKVGILIADVFVKNLFSTLQTYKTLNRYEKVILVSGDGHYLYHSQKKKDWSKLLAGRDKFNLQNDYSEATNKEILSDKKSSVIDSKGDIIYHAPLFYGYSSIFHANIGESFTIPLYLLVAIPNAIIMEPVHTYELTFAGILVLFLFISMGLSLLATQHFTKSIATLTRGAETITKGNYNHRVNVETRDEIEKLAEQFNLMAQSLFDHENEIQKYRSHLEEMVSSRTEELFAEKTKLQAILDNVPSAFLLLDKDLHIQTASAAFNGITGYKIDDVKGESCNKIFGNNGFCTDCICQQAITKSKIETCIKHTLEGKPDERYIEHIAIPMKKNGETIAVLAVITDITRRKKLENVLIKTEKLAATGEIAAFVAHEFRNSLTSIKMILQLLTESENLVKSEKKSISVALNSTREMEDIVTKLLNFAYPLPMKFQTAEIEKILNDSLDFVQLRLQKSKISIRKDIEPLIPNVLLDVSHLKEAVINLLLNAIQSIDEKKNRSEDSNNNIGLELEIAISIKKINLRNTLNDYKVEDGIDYVQIENSDRSRYEITLLKGTKCILIEIADTGMGIERKNISKIFDPFFTTKANGTGLGLQMVKRTVNAHRGIITVESKKGTGTIFKILIPIENDGNSLPEYI
ncbi:MAG: ATP-binding protein [Ignavibacteriaceae bacterium]